MLLAFLGLLAGCGFRSARPGEGARVSVEQGEARVPDAAVIAGAVSGARSWLAGQGALSDGGYPRLVVVVTGVEESSAGIVPRAGEPAARGARLLVRGEATVVEASGEVKLRSGEVVVTTEAAGGGGLEGELLRRDAALRALGFRLGEALAMRVWGHGAPLADRMW